MSIDTLLEAARYLEWEAQQQQIAREDQHKQKELFAREVEFRCSEVVTLSAQTTGLNHHHHHHLAWGSDARHLQAFHVPVVSPPPPSLPPAPLPFAVVPMVPVVTPKPSLAPPHPHAASAPAAALITAAVAASPVTVATPMLNGSSPPPPLLQQKPLPPAPQGPPAPRPLLSSPTVKLEPASHQNGDGAAQSQPAQLQVPYQASFSSTPPSGGVSPHALVPPHSPEMKPNGLMGDDLRGPDGKRRPGGAGTREVHNMLEKNRRAHLKECFETLKKNVPNVDEKKTSNLSVLRGALRYIQTLKRKEKEYEHEMERLAREKIASQQRLAELKNELSLSMDAAEMERVLRQTVAPEDDQVSTSTASEGEEDQDFDDDDDVPAHPPAAALPANAPPPTLQAHPLLALQHAALPLSGVLTAPAAGVGVAPAQPIAPPPLAIAPAPQAVAPHPPQPSVGAAQAQPTVIAHAAVSHPSVIQAVHHPPKANHKHLTPIAPSPGPGSTPLQAPMAMAAAPAGAAQRITVHPLAHLGPAHLFPQTVSVSQPAVLGHITRTFAHHPHPHHHHHTLAPAPAHAAANGVHVNGAGAAAAAVMKPALLAPQPQLVGQATVLNPVTLVNVPVGTLKLT